MSLARLAPASSHRRCWRVSILMVFVNCSCRTPPTRRFREVGAGCSDPALALLKYDIRQKPPLMLGICRHFACENPKFYASTRTWPSNIGCDARQPRWCVPAMRSTISAGKSAGGLPRAKQCLTHVLSCRTLDSRCRPWPVQQYCMQKFCRAQRRYGNRRIGRRGRRHSPSVVSSTSQSVTVRRFSGCCFLEEKFEQPTRRLRAEIVVRGRSQIVTVDVRLVFLDEI
jgi:hypothetical protein